MKQQSGVLAYRFKGDELRILLVTSRETKRWVIPRGNLMLGLLPHESALHEAFEEAGITGRISATPVGIYRYEKVAGQEKLPATVTIFPILVTRIFDQWPEQMERDRQWFSTPDAAAAVAEPDLKNIISAFDPRRF